MQQDEVKRYEQERTHSTKYFHGFEYSTVNAEIKGKVESILKPKSGTIKNNKSRLHQQIDFGRK